jgi:type III restriction enzyme
MPTSACGRQYVQIWKQLEAANGEANPELFRLAMKMATGTGKTTVMAMLIA